MMFYGFWTTPNARCMDSIATLWHESSRFRPSQGERGRMEWSSLVFFWVIKHDNISFYYHIRSMCIYIYTHIILYIYISLYLIIYLIICVCVCVTPIRAISIQPGSGLKLGRPSPRKRFPHGHPGAGEADALYRHWDDVKLRTSPNTRRGPLSGESLCNKLFWVLSTSMLKVDKLKEDHNQIIIRRQRRDAKSMMKGQIETY